MESCAVFRFSTYSPTYVLRTQAASPSSMMAVTQPAAVSPCNAAIVPVLGGERNLIYLIPQPFSIRWNQKEKEGKLESLAVYDVLMKLNMPW